MAAGCAIAAAPNNRIEIVAPNAGARFVMAAVLSFLSNVRGCRNG